MNFSLVAGNRIVLLETGTAFFPALRAAIDGAQSEIYLESYIFENDHTGRDIAAALCAAAQRGVAVRVMVDGFGSRYFARDIMPQMRAANVDVLIYRREISTFTLRRNRLQRLHRKLSVFDQRLAFVGGINIIDDMDTPKQTTPRFDYAVSVEGPLVAAIWTAMTELWDLMSWASFKRRPPSHKHLMLVPEIAGNVSAALVLRANLKHRRDIERAYLKAIELSKQDIVIANAYFLPGRHFRKALLDASQRGVRITLLLQGRVEYWLLYHACRAIYPHLLANGIRIVEYRKSFLHAKVAVVDDDWATVGSSNIDPFSLLLAREANVVVNDRDFTATLRLSLLNAIKDGSVELIPDAWTHRSHLTRLLSWTAYGLVRLLIGLAGYAKQH